MEIVPIILCGGSGTRLWPLSRKNYPKQFVKVVDDNTLFETTLLRIQKADCFARPIIICNEKHQYLCLEQLQALNIEPLDMIIEPEGRDTAAAITIAALRVTELLGVDAIFLVLPIDHVFGDQDRYIEIIKKAADYTANSLVTFGVTPTYAHTGYGYIRRADAMGQAVFAVDQFIEKPSAATAKKLLEEGNVYWNSGTFLFNAALFLKEVARFHAAILECCTHALARAERRQQFLKLDARAFSQCEKISVDYAILEKTDKVVVAQLDVAFTDIGSWESVYEFGVKDLNHNVKRGAVYTEDTHNCMLYTQDTLLVTAGLDDYIVVATQDGILVSKQGASQAIKHMLPKLEQCYPEQFNNQTFVRRPWGSYQVLAVEPNYKVKRLTVKPGAKLSLQLHHYRSEHWVVVAGTADIVYGDEERVLEPGKSVFIPAKTKHRIANNGTTPLVIIETQMGERVDEEDIIRFEDIYERELA